MNTLQFIQELEKLKLDDKAIISALKHVNKPQNEENKVNIMTDIVDELDAVRESIKEHELIEQGDFSTFYYNTVMI